MNAVTEAPRSASRPTATVGLLWHSVCSGNLGVGALTESHIALLAGLAGRLGMSLRLVVVGTSAIPRPDLVERLAVAGHELHNERVRLLRGGFSRTVQRCDLVLDIGEGDSFSTIYGFKRFFYFWLSKNRVCNAGVPLLLAPQTIGPFDSALARAMARQVMRRCEGVFARDSLSRQYLSTLGLDAVAAESTDVAFALPFERQAHGPTGVTRVGLNVSGLLYSGGYTGNNQFGLTLDYAATMRRLVQAFRAMPGVELHLVSHVFEPQRPSEDDLAAAQALAADCPNVIVAPAFAQPGQAKGYIAGLDFFVGARMHSCIAALSAGVPVVPMAYSRKFDGLFGSLGYPRLADCKVHGADEVVVRVMQAFSEIEVVRAEVRQALASVQERLARYEAALVPLLQRVARR